MSLDRLLKNIFSIRENRASRKPNNSNIKHSITMRSCLDKNFYYVNDLLIIRPISIK